MSLWYKRMVDSMGWVLSSWHEVTGVDSGTWLAWAAWAALGLGVVALVVTKRQIQRNRRLAAEQTRPYVAMFMEPHVADWHVIELVVRNFGRTAAYDVRFSFPNPPTVAQYENAANGYADVVELRLPQELPMLAPGQEWRMVWGFSARSRRDRAGHRVSLPGHGDLLRPTRAAAPMAVLAARTASVGDQSGAGLGCPAARCAHRADDHPRPGEAGKAEAGAVT